MYLCRLSVFLALAASLAVTWEAHADNTASLGQTAPVWPGLPGTDGKVHDAAELKGAKATLVVFLCNHCPCAKGYEARFKEFVTNYESKGIKVVAFNSDTSEDLNVMKERAQESQFNFAYLRDENQAVAKAFGAKTTPHVFLLDERRKIVFSGAFDNDMRGQKITQRYIVDAVEALLAGKPVSVTQSALCGCKIHYE